MSKKIRAVVEMTLNESAMEEKNVTAEEILEGLCVRESDVIDAVEIVPDIPGYHITTDFFLQTGHLESAELVDETERNLIEVETPIGKLCAEVGVDPNFPPEIFVFIQREDGVEIDLVAAGVEKENVKAYLYGDTTKDDWTDSYSWHHHEIEEV